MWAEFVALSVCCSFRPDQPFPRVAPCRACRLFCLLRRLLLRTTLPVRSQPGQTAAPAPSCQVHDASFDYYGKRLATASSDRCVKVFDVTGDQVGFSCLAGITLILLVLPGVAGLECHR